jgi:glycine/sarcosine N-methyltransferase
MAPMIDTVSTDAKSIGDFYDRLAPDYDAMTTFEKRFVHEEPFFRLLVQRYRIGTALDAGCGTGFHSILLARLGVSVTAVDVSPRMLHELTRHTSGLGVEIRTVQAAFSELPARVAGPFDALFSMGNTLAHLLSGEDLRAALAAFARLLAPGGILFIQVLNYDRILTTRPEIQSVKETKAGTFIRSYEYHGETIRFSIRKTAGAPGDEERSQSVNLRPVVSEELSGMLVGTGFEEVHLFGSVAMEDFDPVTSKDLVVLARLGTPRPSGRNMKG